MALLLTDDIRKAFFDFLDKATTPETHQAFALQECVFIGFYYHEAARAIANWVNSDKVHFPATACVFKVAGDAALYKIRLSPLRGTFKSVRKVYVYDYSKYNLATTDVVYAVNVERGAALMRVYNQGVRQHEVHIEPAVLMEGFPASLACDSSIEFTSSATMYITSFCRGPTSDPFKDAEGKPLKFLGDATYTICNGDLTVVLTPPVPVPAEEPPVPVMAVAEPPAASAVPVTTTAAPTNSINTTAVVTADDKWVEVPSSPEPSVTAEPAGQVANVSEPTVAASATPPPAVGVSMCEKMLFWSKMNTALLELKPGDGVFLRTGDYTPGYGLLQCKVVSAVQLQHYTFAGSLVVTPVTMPSLEIRCRFEKSYFGANAIICPTNVLDEAIAMLQSEGRVYDPNAKTVLSFC